MIISSETGEVLGSSATRLAGMLRTGKDEAISLGLRIAIKRAMEDPGRGWVIRG